MKRFLFKTLFIFLLALQCRAALKDLSAGSDLIYAARFEEAEKRFQKAVIPTEFVFSSPEQAVAAAKVLFSPIAERVRQQNRAVIPEMIHVFYD